MYSALAAMARQDLRSFLQRKAARRPFVGLEEIGYLTEYVPFCKLLWLQKDVEPKKNHRNVPNDKTAIEAGFIIVEQYF